MHASHISRIVDTFEIIQMLQIGQKTPSFGSFHGPRIVQILNQLTFILLHPQYIALSFM